MKRAYDSNDSFATFNVSHGQMATSMKQMLDDKLFIDAKIASKSSPQEIFQCHRFLLSASSKFFLRKFRKHTNPEAVIIVENVTCQSLRHFLDLIYLGQANVPKEKVSEFKVALFDLKFDKLADDQDDSDDEEQDSERIPPIVPAKVMKMEPETSTVELEQPSTLSTTPKKTPTSAKEEVDRKPIVQGQQTTGNFLENVFNSSKETLIPDFSAQQLHNASLNSSGSTIAPTPSFKPTFVAPPTNSSVISKPKPQVKIGLLNLFWLKFSKLELKKIEPPKNAKHFLLCKNGNDGYISFEIEAEAKEFLKNSKKGAAPVQEVSFNELIPQDAQALDKELSARPRIQLKIENLPKWPLSGVLRMFKTHNILVKKHEVNYDPVNRCIFLQIPDKYLVEKIEQSFHGSVQDGSTLHVVIM